MFDILEFAVQRVVFVSLSSKMPAGALMTQARQSNSHHSTLVIRLPASHQAWPSQKACRFHTLVQPLIKPTAFRLHACTMLCHQSPTHTVLDAIRNNMQGVAISRHETTQMANTVDFADAMNMHSISPCILIFSTNDRLPKVRMDNSLVPQRNCW